MRLRTAQRAVRQPTRLKARTKREAIAELRGAARVGSPRLASQARSSTALRREAMMSTGIGNGIMIPHGKVWLVDRLVVACGVSAEGIEYESVGRRACHEIVLLVAPRAAAPCT